MSETSTKFDTKMMDFLDNIGTFQTAWSVIVTLGLFVMFFICIFAFRTGVNKQTKSQIRRFKREGKYLPDIYVELNNTMEHIRYYIFSYRWKHRVIKQYNHLFHGYEGKRLKDILGNSINCNLSYFTSFLELNAVLDNMHNALDDIRNRRDELVEEHGDVVHAILNSTYNHIYAIKYLQGLCNMMSKKNMILVGSAGNGKTSLLCHMSEVAISNKIPCMLVNSKDIQEDCTEYIIKKLPILAKFRKIAPIYLRIISFILLIKRKNFYIFIDAINENDNEIFTSSLSNLLESLSKYKRIRILLSCRREYFDSRYKMLFSFCEDKPYIFDLQEANYNERSMIKMIRAYMEYFNVPGPFSLDTQKKLKNSLFLTRIFFEVNSNRNESMLEFRNAEIYKLYFEKVAAENKRINLKNIVNDIAEYMFNKFQFDEIPINELSLSIDEIDALKNLLDNNLIISRSVHLGVGITERDEEYVYFVFDELRDFCLAKYLLTLDENNSSVEYELFFSSVQKLFERKLSPVEGTIKYAYHYFKTLARFDLCEKILKIFGESDVQNILDRERIGFHNGRVFNNFGFALIFSEGNNIDSFEIDYIINSIEKNNGLYWEIFWFLLGNEYSGFKPNIQLALDILICCKNETTSENIISYFFEDRVIAYYPYYNQDSRVHNLKEWIDHITKVNVTLSKYLKTIVIILASYDPTDDELEEYHKFILDEELFDFIQESKLSNTIKEWVKSFKESVLSNPIDENAFRTFMEFLKAEGYYEK